MIKVVSFDVWGTLLRSSPDNKRRTHELLRDVLGFRGEASELSAAYRRVCIQLDRETECSGAQFGMQERVSRLADCLHVDMPADDAMTTLRLSLDDALRQYVPQLTEDELPKTFEQLNARGYEIAIICNTNMTDGVGVHEALAHHGLVQWISYELYSNELGFAKPDPRIYAYLTNLAGVMPAEIVHVGDNPITDVEGPQAAGLQARLYNRRRTLPQSSQVIWSHEELLSHLEQEEQA